MTDDALDHITCQRRHRHFEWMSDDAEWPEDTRDPGDDETDEALNGGLDIDRTRLP